VIGREHATGILVSHAARERLCDCWQRYKLEAEGRWWETQQMSKFPADEDGGHVSGLAQDNVSTMQEGGQRHVSGKGAQKGNECHYEGLT